jgi:hypothetical protein
MNTPETSEPVRMDRRSVIKWMLTAAAAVAVMDRNVGAADGATSPGVGYGTDPDLVKIYKPGDVWALTFTASQRRAVTALCDSIIPADDKSPAASKVGVPDFIDEWISAPYPGHDADKRTVVEGLAWLDAESQKRFGNDFADLVLKQKNAICDDICSFGKATPEFKKAAQFFRKFRDLTAGGFYSTPEGMKDIGYVGNVPTAKFDGPTPEALKHLGLM